MYRTPFYVVVNVTFHYNLYFYVPIVIRYKSLKNERILLFSARATHMRTLETNLQYIKKKYGSNRVFLLST